MSRRTHKQTNAADGQPVNMPLLTSLSGDEGITINNNTHGSLILSGHARLLNKKYLIWFDASTIWFDTTSEIDPQTELIQSKLIIPSTTNYPISTQQFQKYCCHWVGLHDDTQRVRGGNRPGHIMSLLGSVSLGQAGPAY